MNYASNILNTLSRSEDFSEVLLAPGAPVVAKKGNTMEVVIDSVLVPQDIRETLTTFHSHTRGVGSSAIGTQGVFSFGMPNLGRFRVHYFTQRSSHVVSIRKIPLAVPDVRALLADPDAVQPLADMVRQGEGGLVFVTSTSLGINIEFVYALLQEIIRSQVKTIYILEEDLSFLLRHQKSIVIQSEVETDVPNLDAGIRNGILLSPNVLYVRNARSREEIISIMEAAETGTLVFVSAIAFNEKALLLDMEQRLGSFYDSFCTLLRKIVRIVHTESGKLALEIFDRPWARAQK